MKNLKKPDQRLEKARKALLSFTIGKQYPQGSYFNENKTVLFHFGTIRIARTKNKGAIKVVFVKSTKNKTKNKVKKILRGAGLRVYFYKASLEVIPKENGGFVTMEKTIAQYAEQD